MQLMAKPKQLFIDGKWVDALAGGVFEVVDPSSGQVIARCAEGTEADVDRAVQAAKAAFKGDIWPAMAATQRAAMLYKLADLIEQHADEIALLESLDTGNSVFSIQHADFPATLYQLREAAGWATKITGTVPMTTAPERGIGICTREPVGVVGAILPWNAPLLMLLQKLGPAIAAGCTLVVKPAELTPLSAIRVFELAEQAGIPAGVINLVTGFGPVAGQALADHHDVNKISFTGSIAVGKSVLTAAGRTNLKRVTLELGGKSPIIVFPDADIDAAARAIALEIGFKSGQFCMAGSRLYVAASVHDALVERMRPIMAGLRMGAGYSTNTDMGPMISEKQRQRAEGIVDSSVGAGAKPILGGKRADGAGFFFEPTILTDVQPGMRAMTEEIFAPVICALPFDPEDGLGAIAAKANDTHFGLSAKIWTKSLGIAHSLSRRLEAGTVFINGGGGEGWLPVGGVKQSGYGREYGLEGMLAYTEMKSINIGF
jgi:phenylacetaldehyde dehydrogenase